MSDLSRRGWVGKGASVGVGVGVDVSDLSQAHSGGGLGLPGRQEGSVGLAADKSGCAHCYLP